ncbi:MAG: chemotaxis protein CheW [Pseudomonadales bacterium]
MADALRFCTFYVDGLLFGVEIEKVQEVIRYQKLTGVPLAPRTIAGLMNLRGEIVTAIGLRRRLGLGEPPADQLPMNVVLKISSGIVSLLVDEIDEIIDVENDAFESPPDTLKGISRELIRGVYKLEERLLLVLDAEATSRVQSERV